MVILHIYTNLTARGQSSWWAFGRVLLPLGLSKGNGRLIYHRAEMVMRTGATRGCRLRDLSVAGLPPGLESVTNSWRGQPAA
jgi:hypothetical protein